MKFFSSNRQLYLVIANQKDNGGTTKLDSKVGPKEKYPSSQNIEICFDGKNFLNIFCVQFDNFVQLKNQVALAFPFI